MSRTLFGHVRAFLNSAGIIPRSYGPVRRPQDVGALMGGQVRMLAAAHVGLVDAARNNDPARVVVASFEAITAAMGVIAVMRVNLDHLTPALLAAMRTKVLPMPLVQANKAITPNTGYLDPTRAVRTALDAQGYWRAAPAPLTAAEVRAEVRRHSRETS